MGVEAALACMLVFGASLALDNLRRNLSADLGMEIQPVVSARLTFPKPVYPDAASLRFFVEAVVPRLAAAPGVEQAAAINTLPFTDEVRMGIRVSAESDTRPMRNRPMSPYFVVSPGYFETLGIPLLSGRDISWTDSSLAPVAVINGTMARELWPDQNPLGKQLTVTNFELRTVVGVVGDARTGPGDGDIGPQVFLPIREQPQAYMSIVVRGERGTEASALLSHIQTAVRAVDAAMPIYAAQPMESVIAASVTVQRTGTRLISFFGAIAVGLAAVGVYGVLAYAVARRTREIGVRMALGATSGQVIYSVMARGLLLVGIGIAFGVAVTLGLRRFLGSVLEELTEASPAVFVVPPLILLLVTFVAVWIPARRASRVDPMIALRAE